MAAYGELLKAVAVVSGRLLNLPSTWRTQYVRLMKKFVIFITGYLAVILIVYSQQDETLLTEKRPGRKDSPSTRPVATESKWQSEKKAARAAYTEALNSEEQKGFQRMPAKKAAEFLSENTEAGNIARQAILHLVKYNSGEALVNNSNFKTPMDIVAELELPSPQDEIVSLRPVLEKAGIKAMKQQGDDCTVYAGMYLTQYWQAVSNRNSINRAEFLELLVKTGRTPAEFLHHYQLAKAIGTLHSKKPNVLVINTRNSKLDRELIKHMLRKGRPVLIQADRGAGQKWHAILCIGFTTEAGKTTFQCIDSNGLDVDNGYRTETSASNATCIWIE